MVSLSVCIPTYNRPTELENLLRSIPPHVAINVSDNGNSLGSEYRDRYPGIVFASPGNSSDVIPVYANWNAAARMASTEWLMLPSDDDIYYPNSFQTVFSSIQENSGADIFIFGHHIIGENYEVLRTWQPQARAVQAPDGFEDVKFGVEARMPSIVIKRSAMEHLGFFDENYVLTASDSELIQRALLKLNVVFVPNVVSGYRVWAQSLTRTTQATSAWMTEIDLWGCKMAKLLGEFPKYKNEALLVRDELYGRNLVSGLHALRAKGDGRRCMQHFRASRFPHAARWTTKAKILWCVAARNIRPAQA